MNEETPILKWTAAAVGVIVVCFCLGYFILGPSARTQASAGGPGESGDNGITIVEGEGGVVASPKPDLELVDRTAQIEAAKKKAAEEAAKKQAAEDAKRLADEAAERARRALLPSPTPSPTPSATPGRRDPDDLPDEPSPAPDASPLPDASPTPEAPVTPTAPRPVPSPRAVTPSPRPVIVPSAPPVAPPTPPTGASNNGVYRVRIVSVADRDSANTLAAELNGRGYSTTIMPEQTNGKMQYRIQVGAYRDEKRAKDIQKELRGNGYNAEVARNGG